MRKSWAAAGVAVVAIAAIAGYLWLGAEREAPSGPEPAAVETGQDAAPTESAAISQPELFDDDKFLGSAEAPVTIIEYASMTCPHCASFHNDTLPDLKASYIDKGLARLVYRDFPLNRPALSAALLAACVPEERYFGMVEVIYRTQDDWGAAADPSAALSQLGRAAGLDQAAIDGCFADQVKADRIVARAQDAQQRYGVDSTPTFVINGTIHAGTLSLAEFDQVLKGLLP